MLLIWQFLDKSSILYTFVIKLFSGYNLSETQGLVYNGDCKDDGSIQILSAGFDEVMAGIITTGNPDLVSVQTKVGSRDVCMQIKINIFFRGVVVAGKCWEHSNCITMMYPLLLTFCNQIINW